MTYLWGRNPCDKTKTHKAIVISDKLYSSGFDKIPEIAMIDCTCSLK